MPFPCPLSTFSSFLSFYPVFPLPFSCTLFSVHIFCNILTFILLTTFPSSLTLLSIGVADLSQIAGIYETVQPHIPEHHNLTIRTGFSFSLSLACIYSIQMPFLHYIPMLSAAGRHVMTLAVICLTRINEAWV